MNTEREAHSAKRRKRKLHTCTCAARQRRCKCPSASRSGPHPSERGQVLVWTAVLLPLLLALVGLVFDGGLLWAQHRRARWAADGAAVAAASEIDQALFAQTGQVRLNVGQAAATAQRFAWFNNSHLRIGSVYVQGNVVVVQGWIEVEPVFLQLIGVGSVQLNVTGRERPAWGIAQQGE